VKDATPFLKSLGSRVREQRTALRLSIDKLADATDLSKTHLWQIERGESCPGAAVLWRLSRALRVSIDWIVAGTQPAWAAEGD
jgi:XRE family transcriptional regulator, regulator of sulfur utilization